MLNCIRRPEKRYWNRSLDISLNIPSKAIIVQCPVHLLSFYTAHAFDSPKYICIKNMSIVCRILLNWTHRSCREKKMVRQKRGRLVQAIGFILKKSPQSVGTNSKYIAFCVSCRKNLKNIATKRLILHRCIIHMN